MPIINGTANDEHLPGTAGDDTINGLGGADALEGFAGDDLLDGGDGTDMAVYWNAAGGVVVDLQTGQASGGGEGSDTLISIEGAAGGAFDDVLIGDGGANLLIGEGGNDTLQGRDGDSDNLNGGSGDDVLDGGAGLWDAAGYWDAAGGVTVDLNIAGGQAVGGGMGVDTLIGIESLYGSAHNDTLTGDEGENIVSGAEGNDQLDGRGGFDSVDYYWATGVVVNLATGTASGGHGVDSLANFEGILGSFDGDTLTGNAQDNYFNPRGGDDWIDGAGGWDTLDYAEASGDVVVDLADGAASGGGGNDSITGVERVSGSQFNDSLSGDEGGNSFGGRQGDDHIDGRGGVDTIEYYEAAGGVTVDLSVTTAQEVGGGEGFDTILNIEHVHGGAFGDRITGDGGDNFVHGQAGDDTVDGAAGFDNLLGGEGNDVLLGGTGDDHLEGAQGDDVLDGGDGIDGAVYWSAGGGVSVDLSIAGPQDVGAGLGSDTFISIENLHGSGFGDTLAGDGGANMIFGNGGEDSIQGLGGDDNLQGGVGDDTLDGGAGADLASYWTANGGVTVSLATAGPQAVGADQGVDVLVNFEALQGGAFDDHLTGDAGNNLLLGGPTGNDVLVGLDGADTLLGQLGADTLQGGAGFDVALGGAGDDSLDGGAGDDFLRGEAGHDTIAGGDGDDFLVGAGGNDSFDGGAGFDRASFFGAPAVHVDLSVVGPQNTGAGFDTLIDVEHVSGTLGGDTLVGNAEANWLWGSGGGSADSLSGAGGDDLLMVGAGDHVLAGGDGVDTVALPIPTDVADGVAISLVLQGAAQATTQGSMTLTGIENLSGTVYADTLTGDAGDNVLAGNEDADLLEGGAGNDTLLGDGAIDILSSNGGSGAIHTYLDLNDFPGSNHGGDTLVGGAGDDVLRGGGEDDWLEGGDGVDRAVFSGAAADYHVETQADGSIVVTDLRVDGPDGIDTLVDVEVLSFADGDLDLRAPAPEPVVIHGGNQGDVLTGGGGDDQLFGENGKDSLAGGAGDDVLDGGNAKDRLDGGAGNDTLTGGEAPDVFVFSDGDDRITDFGNGKDQIAVDSDFQTVLAGAEQVGADVVITLGGDTVTLVGFALSSLSADDFLFG